MAIRINQNSFEIVAYARDFWSRQVMTDVGAGLQSWMQPSSRRWH